MVIVCPSAFVQNLFLAMCFCTVSIFAVVVTSLTLLFLAKIGARMQPEESAAFFLHMEFSIT